MNSAVASDPVSLFKEYTTNFKNIALDDIPMDIVIGKQFYTSTGSTKIHVDPVISIKSLDMKIMFTKTRYSTPITNPFTFRQVTKEFTFEEMFCMFITPDKAEQLKLDASGKEVINGFFRELEDVLMMDIRTISGGSLDYLPA